jgi:hypothetical protein
VRSLDPIRVQISAPFMQHQFLRPTVAVGHKSDLTVKEFEEVIANTLREELDFRTVICAKRTSSACWRNPLVPGA